MLMCQPKIPLAFFKRFDEQFVAVFFSPVAVNEKLANVYAVVPTYRKVASRSTSWLVAHPRIFRLFMKGKFDSYVL